MIDFIKRLLKKIDEDNIYSEASRMAYSLVMGIIPLIMFIITLCARFQLPIKDIYEYLRFLLPKEAYDIVYSVIEEVLASTNYTLFTFAILIYFISSGIRTTMLCLNNAYKDKEERKIITVILLSLVFAVVFSFVLVLSLVTLVFGGVIFTWMFEGIGFSYATSEFLSYFRYIISFLVLGFVFCIIYKGAISHKQTFRQVYIGAYLAAFFWIVASLVFSIYVNNFSNYGLLFGSLGGIFVLLVWLYITAFIVLLGGEINALLNSSKGEV